MNFWPFRPTPTPTNDTEPSRPERTRSRNGRFATPLQADSEDNKRTNVELQLAVHVANTTQRQRHAETAAYYAVARAFRRSA